MLPDISRCSPCHGNLSRISDQLEPFLWTNLCSKHARRAPLSRVARNLRHIRTVDLSAREFVQDGAIEWESLEGLLKTLAGDIHTQSETHRCSYKATSVLGTEQSAVARVAQSPRLRRLRISLCSPKARWENTLWCYFTTILYNSSGSLTHLQLDIVNQGDIPPQLSRVIPALQHLQHFVVNAGLQTENAYLSLLRAFLPLPRLSELFCDFPVNIGRYPYTGDLDDDYDNEDSLAEPRGELKAILEEAIAARTSENGFINVKIKALGFPQRHGAPLIRIIFPLLKSDLVEIEALKIPELFGKRTEKCYENMLRKYCPGLRHLIIAPHDGKVRSFIRGATRLRTVRGYNYSDQMSELAEYHSETLEVLEIRECMAYASADQRSILTSCKQLKRFWIVPDVHRLGECGLKFGHILDQEWRCRDLRELCLTLERTVDVDAIVLKRHHELPALPPESLLWILGSHGRWTCRLNPARRQELDYVVAAWAAKQVFAQIGRLRALETLALGASQNVMRTRDDLFISEWDLTLSMGWLAELAGLKNLRHLNLRTDYWSRMGQAEVEFMDAEWPLLGEITFDVTNSDFCDVVKQAHWQWLRQRRPNLCLRGLRF
ncbi:unnamed protein product [Mortierella alpina]